MLQKKAQDTGELAEPGWAGLAGSRGKGDVGAEAGWEWPWGAPLLKRGWLRLRGPSQSGKRIQHSTHSGVRVLCWEGGGKLQPRDAHIAVHPCGGICPRWGHIFLVCPLGRELLACFS